MAPGSEFNDPILQGDELLLRGPYDPATGDGQEVVGDVLIRYLLFSTEDEKPKVRVQGVAFWSPERNPDGTYKHKQWTARVAANGLQLNETIRAVGVAVQATKYDTDPRVPPSIAAVNWCVTRQVVAEEERSGERPEQQ